MSKARHLIDGLRTDALDLIKAQIMTNSSLRRNFDRCMKICKDFLDQNVKTPPEVNASAAKSKGGDSTKGR